MIKLTSRAIVLLAVCCLGCSNKPAPRPEAKLLEKITLSRPVDYKVVKGDWGTLTWFVSGEQGNSATMTVGQAVLKPGQSSPRHHHPNCEEVLHVIKGTIQHTIDGEKTVAMSAGDTVTIPVGIPHNARNTGTDEAVMIISFSTAHRKAVNH